MPRHAPKWIAPSSSKSTTEARSTPTALSSESSAAWKTSSIVSARETASVSR
jgi:hypothetical protein